nr:zinc finger, CCHC-type [Tanacetum cinerariifolium]
IKGSKEIVGLMLMTMEPEIQRNLEPLHANEMLQELKTLFSQQAEHELLHTTRDFHSCRQEEGQGQNHGKGKNKQAYAPKPKILPHLKGKIPQRTQFVKSVVRQDTGRGIVLSI